MPLDLLATQFTGGANLLGDRGNINARIHGYGQYVGHMERISCEPAQMSQVKLYVLADVDLTIQRGEFIVLLDPSGAASPDCSTFWEDWTGPPTAWRILPTTTSCLA
jgi:hypothetical protein